MCDFMNQYLKFLKEKSIIYEYHKEMSSVDSIAQHLLEHIAIEHEKKQPMTVSQAMALRKIGSPSTLHRKIDDLRIAGLIKMTFMNKNRRTKYLVPTKAANEYFYQIGNALLRAMATEI